MPSSKFIYCVLLCLGLTSLLGCSGQTTPQENVVTDAGVPKEEKANPKPLYPPLDQGPQNKGPGGPAVEFKKEDLFKNCAFLSGGEKDIDHHNIVLMFDGYLLMPWAPEYGGGGISFYDIKDPCNPKRVGSPFSNTMRESHSVGIANINNKWYAVVNGIEGFTKGGVQFWDITDVTQPKVVSNLSVPGFQYPDAYKRVVLSVFWQGRYVYAAGSQNGIHIIDAKDPSKPKVVGKYQFTPVMDAGQVQVIGNLMVVITAEEARTVLLDVSDPTQPKPRPNGEILTKDRKGKQRKSYFGTTTNGYIFYARKSSGSGLIVYDIRDPDNPKFAGDLSSKGNGGYVYVKDNLAFMGESSVAHIYDFTDLSNIVKVGTMNLVGDLDTVTPIGNMAVLSVDDKAEKGKGSALAPFTEKPDQDPPYVTWVFPKDKAKGLATTSRIGLTFNEFVDPKSVWHSSVRVYTQSKPTKVVQGWLNTQESIVNFTPKEPLEPKTTYILELPAGGVKDYNGNPIAKPFQMTFTTGSK